MAKASDEKMGEKEIEAIEALAKLFKSKWMRKFKKDVHNVVLAIKAPVYGTTVRELKKKERRVAYHYRLSERNRLHPKKKPKGGR